MTSMSSEFMPLALDKYYASSAYTSKTDSSQDLTGMTISDPNDSIGLDFEDFLQLMVAQLQNQTIDSSMDTSDMLNQLVQMSVVQMMSTLQTGLETLTQASTMTYAASLVGKTVTVGKYDEEGNIEEIVGTVTGTGTYQGAPVIFVNDEMYYLSSIIAVGTLPEVPENPDEGTDGEDQTDGNDQTGDQTQQIET